jgi:hypothetical protein
MPIIRRMDCIISLHTVAPEQREFKRLQPYKTYGFFQKIKNVDITLKIIIMNI